VSSAGAGPPLHSASKTMTVASFGRIARMQPPSKQLRHHAQGAVQRANTIET
jgi:hypothetical protein